MGEGFQQQRLSESILKTLLYYDIFSYPLTPAEIFRFLPTNGVTQQHVDEELTSLTRQAVVFRVGNFFSIQNEVSLSQRREAGNTLADINMRKARKRAALIASFPFIRGVMISGSLSKGYMDEKSDIDFFMVAAPGRLWIARTLLVIFKRIFLRNSHKYFCVNYFVDTDHLEIEEKNLFTATELATLIPMVNSQLYDDLLGKNRWLKSFFPNYSARPTADVLPPRDSWFKHIMEFFLNAFFGKRAEQFFKAKTYTRWRNMYGTSVAGSDFDTAFKSTNHTSKSHPQNFQRKVMDLYTSKVAKFELPKEVSGV